MADSEITTLDVYKGIIQYGAPMDALQAYLRAIDFIMSRYANDFWTNEGEFIEDKREFYKQYIEMIDNISKLYHNREVLMCVSCDRIRMESASEWMCQCSTTSK